VVKFLTDDLSIHPLIPTIHNDYYNSYMFRHRGPILREYRKKVYKPNTMV